jgi:hypothetical protein
MANEKSNKLKIDAKTPIRDGANGDGWRAGGRATVAVICGRIGASVHRLRGLAGRCLAWWATHQMQRIPPVTFLRGSRRSAAISNQHAAQPASQTEEPATAWGATVECSR